MLFHFPYFPFSFDVVCGHGADKMGVCADTVRHKNITQKINC